jgi:CMP/dCMP kinase
MYNKDKYMIITFNGNEGSGKSTISKMVAEKLGYELLDGGVFFRSVAKKNNFTLTELRALRIKDPKWDYEIDNQIKELGEKRDNIVVGGRTAWHLIPHSLKIYLKVDEREAAERIREELQKSQARSIEEGQMNSTDSIMESQRRRKEEDIQIYKKHYGVDIHDPKNYDLVLDTTGLSIDEVFEKVMGFVNSRA